MTELEKMARAKMYMEKLAKGIDPIDDTEIPEGDTVNNARLSRCFLYVADVLSQVIDAGGVNAPAVKKTKKEAFSITAEQAAGFEFSRSPITVSEIVKRINGIIDAETVKGVSAAKVMTWLESIGAVKSELDTEGKKHRRPTENGVQLGITTERRTGMYGKEYTAVVFDRDAQQFVLDNIETVCAYADAVKAEKKEKKKAEWTPDQEEYLRVLHRNGSDAEKIARIMKRSFEDVRRKIEQLELGE